MGDEQVGRRWLLGCVRSFKGTRLFFYFVLQELLTKGGGMHRLDLYLRKVLASIWMISAICIYLSLLEPMEFRALSGFNDLRLSFIQSILQGRYNLSVSLNLLLSIGLSQWRKPRGSPPLIRIYSHLR